MIRVHRLILLLQLLAHLNTEMFKQQANLCAFEFIHPAMFGELG